MVNPEGIRHETDKTLIRPHEECIEMKDEEADWLIYHLVARGTSVMAEDLASASGLDPSAIAGSLERLERNLLIEKKEGRVRVLTIGEALLLCQIKYSPDLPYTIENGVIRMRKK
jgi:hypothetical protein